MSGPTLRSAISRISLFGPSACDVRCHPVHRLFPLFSQRSASSCGLVLRQADFLDTCGSFPPGDAGLVGFLTVGLRSRRCLCARRIGLLGPLNAGVSTTLGNGATPV